MAQYLLSPAGGGTDDVSFSASALKAKGFPETRNTNSRELRAVLYHAKRGGGGAKRRRGLAQQGDESLLAFSPHDET